MFINCEGQTESQDGSVHTPQLLKTKESRSRFEPRSLCLRLTAKPNRLTIHFVFLCLNLSPQLTSIFLNIWPAFAMRKVISLLKQCFSPISRLFIATRITPILVPESVAQPQCVSDVIHKTKRRVMVDHVGGKLDTPEIPAKLIRNRKKNELSPRG